MKDEQSELKLNVKFSPPTYNQVQLEAQKMELPEDEAALFYSFFQSNGWKVGRVQMKSWKDALNTWRLRWLKTSTAGRVRSVWELTKISEAKQKIADGLRQRHTIEVATGRKWNDEAARLEHHRLTKEIIQINQQIAGM